MLSLSSLAVCEGIGGMFGVWRVVVRFWWSEVGSLGCVVIGDIGVYGDVEVVGGGMQSVDTRYAPTDLYMGATVYSRLVTETRIPARLSTRDLGTCAVTRCLPIH